MGHAAGTAARQGGDGTVAPRVLESLVCPLTGTRLSYDAARGELISRNAGLAYPIRLGIPIMIADEARKLDE
ncbi:MAG: Trm112 family protein [Pseudomonadota bacterium]